MYQILNPAFSGNNHKVSIQNLSPTRAIVSREIHKVVSYYHKQPTLVNPKHILVQLIDKLMISLKRADFSIVDACMDRTPQVAKALGFVHPLNSNAEIFTGQFYNKHINEIIIVDDSEEPDYELIKTRWFMLSAIKIITHPFNDIDMNLCDGKYPSYNTSGTAGFIVNVPMLMLQYKYWIKRGLAAESSTAILSPRHFISQLVIPNLLSEHLDICFINRAMTIYRQKPVPLMYKRHPFQMADYTSRVDEIIEQQVEAFRKAPFDTRNFYTLFASLLKESWLLSIKLPDIAPTINTRWALELYSLPYILFMCEVLSNKDVSKLDDIRGRIKRDVKILSNNKETHYLSHNSLVLILGYLNIS